MEKQHPGSEQHSTNRKSKSGTSDPKRRALFQKSNTVKPSNFPEIKKRKIGQENN